MASALNPLRLNVGFLLQQPAGYRRVFAFDERNLSLAPDFKLPSLTGEAEITRTPQGLVVQSFLQAVLPAECSRCLTDFHMSAAAQFTELFAFSDRHATESELILPEDGHLDLAPLAREFLLLEIPINPICRTDCAGLCPVCGINLNQESCEHSRPPLDARLEVMKSPRPKKPV